MSPRHIHLIGICGTAMASLAGLLREKGIHVTGSDSAAYPPMSEMLAAWDIPVHGAYDAANLDPRPDLVVVGNAISRGNPELERVLDERIPFCSLPQLLREEFLRSRRVLAVAGTHGKTTTTSMLAWIFESAGRGPSFLVGGVAENFASSFALRDSEHFILEADEYDTAFFDKGPKFLHYFPESAILTSVEFDHADIFPDLEAVKTAFKRLVNLLPRNGRLLCAEGDAVVAECVAGAFCPVETYGFGAAADWRITDLDLGPEKTRWTVLRDGKAWGRFDFPLAGRYNVMNATAAAALAAHHGISAEASATALRGFKSVRRRLEVRAIVRGVTIIDDFAHHPTAIRETLLALRGRYPGSRLWAVLEPRSNTLRRKVLEAPLIESLASVDRVILGEVFRPEVIAEAERMSPQRVTDALRARGIPADAGGPVDDIVSLITREAVAGDVVAILSNGGFGDIYRKLPAALRSHPEGKPSS